MHLPKSIGSTGKSRNLIKCIYTVLLEFHTCKTSVSPQALSFIMNSGVVKWHLSFPLKFMSFMWWNAVFLVLFKLNYSRWIKDLLQNKKLLLWVMIMRSGPTFLMPPDQLCMFSPGSRGTSENSRTLKCPSVWATTFRMYSCLTPSYRWNTNYNQHRTCTNHSNYV